MIYLENNNTDPYYNLAYEEYIFNKNNNNQYFWLWQNDNAVIIGKNQNAHEEVNNDYVKEHNIKVVRRITGGGAVYHDLGNINFTFVAEKSGENIDFNTFTNPLIKALSSFGVKAENSGRNDITINGKKISGNAQYISNNKILHHGTLLFNSNLDILNYCLNVPEEKIKSKGVSSVKSRVCNISDYINIDIQQFKAQLVKYILSENNFISAHKLTEYDKNEIIALTEKKYKTWEWNYGKSPIYNYKNEIRIDNCGTVSLYIELKNDTIISCRIKGDFFHLKDTRGLEGIIENTPIRDIREKLSYVSVSDYIKNLSNEDFIKIISTI